MARRLAQIVALGVASAVAARAHAESSAKATADGISELAAPASRAEVRIDAGAWSALGRRDAGRAAFDVELAPRPDYWYGLGLSVVTTTTVTKTTMGAEVITVSKTVEDLGLSARLFKRLGPLVLDGGFVDNLPALGLELRVLRDRLRAEALLTQIHVTDLDARQNLRVGASAQLWIFYAQGGVFDVQHEDRALYLGGGMRWTDGDLAQAMWWLRR